MRVVRGIAERQGNARLEFLRDHVFQAVGLGMHLVPRIPQHLRQVGFDQAMVADDLQSHLAAGGSQFHAVVFLVNQQGWRGGGHLLNHAGG